MLWFLLEGLGYFSPLKLIVRRAPIEAVHARALHFFLLPVIYFFVPNVLSNVSKLKT